MNEKSPLESFLTPLSIIFLLFVIANSVFGILNNQSAKTLGKEMRESTQKHKNAARFLQIILTNVAQEAEKDSTMKDVLTQYQQRYP